MVEYKVKFEVFEGPLDLLLYLIKKEEVDIYEVNLTKLANQFIEYIEVMRMMDLDIAGEFLVMAATLMYIKSRELLPVEKQIDPVEEDDGDDPRWELIRQLVAYKKFKDAAAQMQQLEDIQENTYPRMPVKPDLEPETTSHRPDASLFDLINAVNTVLQRLNKREDLRDIFEEKWTVSEKIEHLMRLTDEHPSLSFMTLFSEATTRYEVVVTFLALLELIRLHQLAAVQLEPFGEITISKATASTLAPAPSGTAESSIIEEPKAVTGDLFSQKPAIALTAEHSTPSGDANPAH